MWKYRRSGETRITLYDVMYMFHGLKRGRYRMMVDYIMRIFVMYTLKSRMII